MKRFLSLIMIVTSLFIISGCDEIEENLEMPNEESQEEVYVNQNYFEAIKLTAEEAILTGLLSSNALFYKFYSDDYSNLTFKTYIVHDGEVDVRTFDVQLDKNFGYLSIDLDTKGICNIAYKVYSADYKSSYSSKQNIDYSEKFKLTAYSARISCGDDIKNYTSENFFYSVTYSTSSSNYKLGDIITNADKMYSNSVSLVYSVTFS